jgi:hypothetical protein
VESGIINVESEVVRIAIEERVNLSPESYIEVDNTLTNPDAWPIQIRNGVISIDFGAGCLGCSWCVTKRQPGRNLMQHLHYRNALNSDIMLSLLYKTRAFTEAKLPIRIGNNTDGTLIPVRILENFYRSLPVDYPIALLTRGIHSEELNCFLASTKKNFVLCRTITPPHLSIDYRLPWHKAFKRGFADVQCQKVLNIGPIVRETYDDTKRILESGLILPETRVIIAPFYRRLIPAEALTKVTAEPITNNQMGELEQIARDNGLKVHRSNNCAIADYNQRPSLDFGDINYDVHYINAFQSKTKGTSHNRGLDSICSHCANFEVCTTFYQSKSSISENRIVDVAQSLGITNIQIKHQVPGLVTIYAPEITKSETSYLSGILDTRLTSINSLAQPDKRAAERWIQSSFYPVKEIISLSDAFDPLGFVRYGLVSSGV